MNFSQACVMLVLWICIVFGSMILDIILDDDGCVGWLVSSLGFAICLTLLLIQHGII